MTKKLIFACVIIALLAWWPTVAADQEWEEVFTMWDPQDDADGPGGYFMPSDQSFPRELPQMLDLTGFRVFNTPDAVRFEFHFAEPPDLHQPWDGKGFNFHRIDLYIVTGGQGSTETFRPGASVEFAVPWQYCLRLRDWEGTYLLHWQRHDPQDPRAGLWQNQVQGFDVFVQGNMIVAEINHTLLGTANSSWQYYVLVGLQDPHGPDHYREVTRDGGAWTGGGGCDSEFNPNLYDILAETAQEQYKQLDWDVGQLAVLNPVGPEANGNMVWSILRGVGVAALAAAAAIIVWIVVRR